eukprot:1182687-Prorocentrum_minimum.AAC.9
MTQHWGVECTFAVIGTGGPVKRTGPGVGGPPYLGAGGAGGGEEQAHGGGLLLAIALEERLEVLLDPPLQQLLQHVHRPRLEKLHDALRGHHQELALGGGVLRGQLRGAAHSQRGGRGVLAHRQHAARDGQEPRRLPQAPLRRNPARPNLDQIATSTKRILGVVLLLRFTGPPVPITARVQSTPQILTVLEPRRLPQPGSCADCVIDRFVNILRWTPANNSPARAIDRQINYQQVRKKSAKGAGGVGEMGVCGYLMGELVGVHEVPSRLQANIRRYLSV